MVDSKSYHDIWKLILKYAENITRFTHHILFISTYVKFNCVPKGFRLRFHNNSRDCDYEPTMLKCSKKLMIKTIGTYKRKLNMVKEKLKDSFSTITTDFPHKHRDAYDDYCRRSKRLQDILLTHRTKKFTRDGLDLQKAG